MSEKSDRVEKKKKRRKVRPSRQGLKSKKRIEEERGKGP
jgi:hypothetical protein